MTRLPRRTGPRTVADDLREERRRIEDALLHYWIAEQARREVLPVDWVYVCRQMAKALAPDDDDGAAEGHRLAHETLYGHEECRECGAVLVHADEQQTNLCRRCEGVEQDDDERRDE